jgi:hypothetical protein
MESDPVSPVTGFLGEVEKWLLDILEDMPATLESLFRSKEDFEPLFNAPHPGFNFDQIKNALDSLSMLRFITMPDLPEARDASARNRQVRDRPRQFVELTALGGGYWLGIHDLAPSALITFEGPLDDDTRHPTLRLMAIDRGLVESAVLSLNNARFVAKTAFRKTRLKRLRYWYPVTTLVDCRIVGRYSWSEFNGNDHNADSERFWSLFNPRLRTV